MNTVEVIYAQADAQKKVTLRLEDGATAEDAIKRSGLLTLFPQIDLRRNQVGIYGRPVALNKVVRAGDRVEIYRSLHKSPVEQRRERARSSGA